MKVLIYSDSHGDISSIVEIFEKEKPDLIISAGDNAGDFREFKLCYNELQIPYHVVRGNCDHFNRDFPDEEIFEIEGVRIFLTHGHLYGVKSDLESLRKKAKELEVQVTIFGHTHRYQDLSIDNCRFFNPGALKDGHYAVLEIENKKLSFFKRNLW